MGEGSPTASAAKSARKLASVTSGLLSSRPLSKSELLSSLHSDLPRADFRRIDLIVLHCSDTRPSQDFTLEKLAASHRARGFGKYPGYHFYVRRDGTLYYCRPLSIAGCHVKGYNANSIGVCYEGGHRENEIILSGGEKEKGKMKNLPISKYEDNRTAEQQVTLHELLCTLHELFPRAKIVGHRDLPGVAKACPCFDAEKEYAYIL